MVMKGVVVRALGLILWELKATLNTITFTHPTALQTRENVTKHLKSLGIEYELKLGEKVTKKQLSEFSEIMNLPNDLQEFYLEVGDGLTLRYETQGKDEVHTHVFIIMSLEYMLENKEGTQEGLEESLNDSTSPQATKNLKKALNWIPFKDDLDGSYICSDPHNKEIVYYRVYKNWESPIVVIDKSFYDFFYNYSLFCFSDIYDNKTKDFNPFNSFLSQHCEYDKKTFKWSNQLFMEKLNRKK